MSGNLDFEAPFTVRWKVRVPIKSSDVILSPKFRFKETIWHFYFSTGGAVHGMHAIYHSLFIRDESDFCPHIPFRVEVQVVSGSTGQFLPTLFWDKKNSGKLAGLIWEENLREIQLADPGFAQHRTLTFVATFEEIDLNPQPDREEPECTKDVSIPCLKSLSLDLAKLLDEDSDPDIQFQCEDQKIRVHSSILRVRSPVLAKMLQSDMLERKTGVVKIPDMDPDTLLQFARYLYTGNLDKELTFESAMNLYESGDEYEVKSLAKRCSKYLLQNLSVENACEILALADAHSDAELVEAVTEYILDKQIPLSESSSWSEFSDTYPKLANEVLSRFCKMLSK